MIRIKYAGIDLDPNLKSGQYRELTLSEVNKLRKSVKLEPLDKIPEPMSAQGTKGTKKQSVKPKLLRQMQCEIDCEDNQPKRLLLRSF